MERPITGRDLARLRLALGLSLNQVAAAMGTTHHSVQRWEQSVAPIPPERATRWRKALADLAAQRSVILADQGFGPRDLPRDLRRAIATLAGQ
jgi:transcriptional regulator with XRE-family HTH domain